MYNVKRYIIKLFSTFCWHCIPFHRKKTKNIIFYSKRSPGRGWRNISNLIYRISISQPSHTISLASLRPTSYCWLILQDPEAFTFFEIYVCMPVSQRKKNTFRPVPDISFKIPVLRATSWGFFCFLVWTVMTLKQASFFVHEMFVEHH